MQNLLNAIFTLCLLGWHQRAMAYLVGVGRGDCTGPPVGVNFMGYAALDQKGIGMHLRQFARAFIIDDAKHRVAFVSIDACMISDSVKREVVKKLQEKYGNLYQLGNVALSGTHTHAAPGGFNEYTMYDIPNLGFVKETHHALITGIYDSIVVAHGNMQSAKIFIDETEILDANINRSPSAYLNNPENERAQYKYDTDKTLTQIRFVGTDDRPIGVLNWYSIHATSLNNKNKLLSSDNVGYASILLERELNSGSLIGHGTVVAAFASTNLGDSSPNTNGAHCTGSGRACDVLTSECPKSDGVCMGRGPGVDDLDSCRIIGEKLFAAAMKVLNSAGGIKVTGNVNYIHQFIDMPHANTTYRNSTSKVEHIVTGCSPAMGYSFAAGTTDGPGLVDFFNQGQKTGNYFWNTVRNFIARPIAADVQCQAPKPILLATGRATFPNPWQPQIVPTQLFQIGNVMIAAVPGEFTTMSGRRLRNILKLAAGNNSNVKVIVAGLSNSYSSYITTPEEYQIQRYEGASTIFGPYTLSIYLSQYEKLFKALSQQIELDPGPSPPDFSGRLITLVPPPLFDSAPWGSRFGRIKKQPKEIAERGEEIHVEFISSNPRNGNNLMHGKSYFIIEKQSNESWMAVASDADWETRFIWKRKFLLPSHSVMHIYWNTTNAEPATYRITIYGIAKSILGKISEYSGETQPFQLI